VDSALAELSGVEDDEVELDRLLEAAQAVGADGETANDLVEEE
jgi:hypothetical protein